MVGQARKDPFHVNRDVVRDNVTVVRKLRLVRGAQIRARRQYATADNSAGDAAVSMPYTGALNVVSAGANNIVVNNPFITSTTQLRVNGGPAGATFTYTNPGQATLSGVVAGTYVLGVGAPNDARNNGFSQ